MMEAANIARMSAISSKQTKMTASLVYDVSRKSSQGEGVSVVVVMIATCLAGDGINKYILPHL